MASLTETAQIARTAFKYLIVLIIVSFVGFYTVRYVMRTFFAEKAVIILPTERFVHKLPPLVFPESGPAMPDVSLDTLSGDLPQIDRIATVHGLLKQKSTFRGKEQAVRRAQRLGFTGQPKQIDTDVLEFTDEQLPSRTFTIDVSQNHFMLKYNYLIDNSVFTSSTATFEEEAVIREAREILFGIANPPQELASGTSAVEYFEFSQNQLIPVEKPQEADAVRINFFRAPVDNQPVVFASPSQSSTYVLLGQTVDRRKRVLEATYTFKVISDPKPDPTDKRDPNPTYYIKSPEQAFEELQAGKGYVAQTAGESSVVVTDVSLAYYESPESAYLYPIFVFVGDGFTAYVSALLDEYIATEDETEAVQGISTQSSPKPTAVDLLLPGTDRRSPKPQRKFSDLLVE